MKITLTQSQRSALECAGLMADDEGDAAVLRAWDGANSLVFGLAESEDLASALNGLSNSEDGAAEHWRGRKERELARASDGAALALANLSYKVRRAASEYRGSKLFSSNVD